MVGPVSRKSFLYWRMRTLIYKPFSIEATGLGGLQLHPMEGVEGRMRGT
jgi:hypothetical protein